jgi:type VI secretion system protein ImpM
MRCGIYGKLPAKRDFVAVSAPREFLDVWEPWLQGGVSASRLKLGGEWQAAYLRAPIWRFWLGAELCGSTVLGAFMPSVDGVGRYFPLTVFASAEGGAPIPPPEFEPQDAWFETMEGILLSVLDDAARYEAFTAAVSAAGPPATDTPRPPLNGLIRLSDGTTVVAAPPDKFKESLAAIRTQDHEHVYGAATFWWTHGGDGIAPIAIAATRMPHPQLFSGMLTGSFDGTII